MFPPGCPLRGRERRSIEAEVAAALSQQGRLRSARSAACRRSCARASRRPPCRPTARRQRRARRGAPGSANCPSACSIDGHRRRRRRQAGVVAEDAQAPAPVPWLAEALHHRLQRRRDRFVLGMAVRNEGVVEAHAHSMRGGGMCLFRRRYNSEFRRRNPPRQPFRARIALFRPCRRQSGMREIARPD